MSSLILSLCSIILLASNTLSFLNISHQQLSSFNLQNLTASGTDLGVDPRFKTGVQETGDDLTDKSTYMNGLKTLVRLSDYGFTEQIPESSWSWPGYRDVTILVQAPNPGETLETRFAIWGLWDGIGDMAQSSFPSIRLTLFWSGTIVGYINIYKTPSRRIGVAESVQDVNRTVVYNTTERPSRSNFRNFSLVAPTSMNSTSGATNPSFKAFIELDGPRLTKDGVFMTIYGGIVVLAGFDRTQPLTRRLTINDPQSRTLLEIEPWNFPERAERPFEWRAAIYMISKVPVYMYRQNSFRGCSFVVEMDGSPVGSGTLNQGTHVSSVTNAR